MATDMHESSKQPQPYSDSENITDTVYDVKVCDICGDAGQKDSLAICNRCSDGAEHIYCMETMLDELPDGDWLCEECKFKDYENQKVHKFEIVTKTQDSYLDEDAQLGRSTIFSEAPPKKDGSLVKEDIADSRTLQISEIPSMRHGLNVDLNTVTCEKSSIRSPVSAESSVPRDVSLLSPGDPDSATMMPSNPERLSRSWSILKGQKAQTSSGSSRDGFKVISGPQLKTSSFKNTSTKPKVKQLLGAIPLAEIATGKAPYKNSRKGGLTRGMVKSTSFKTEKGVCNGFESVNEKRSAKLTQIRSSNVEWNIELGVTERENSSASDIHQVLDRGLIDRDKSGKVLEAAKKFPPYKVQLEEVPCVSFWPPHFHGNLAKDQNIALFFFAKDMESYRSNYCKLLEKMLKFDLALKGNLGGFELLIFPSNKLSENSQRWNRLLFLWGTFKGSSSSFGVLPNGKKDPCKATMDAKLPATSQEASVSPALSTGIENKICNANKYLCHASVDAKLQSENQHPSPLVNLPAITSQVPSLHHSCSESSMQRKTT